MVALLEAVLTEVPRLPGARCTSAPHLFDPRGQGEPREDWRERQAQAATLCASCPALSACQTWALTQPPHARDHVLGGHTPAPCTTTRIGEHHAA
ncbi:WhiB family transcriptional regulator [Gordonia sp. CPCC 205515]|uniref:WhiB family transcriptional regulator n=1 Tax=Gordonia sp. CPCC 205515 TaxID=3140791 RepID=UPI003AF359FE